MATFFSIHVRFMLFLSDKLLLILQHPAQMSLLWETFLKPWYSDRALFSHTF